MKSDDKNRQAIIRATTDRVCPVCKQNFLVSTSHSTGALHAVCLRCNVCPDCDDGE